MDYSPITGHEVQDKDGKGWANAYSRTVRTTHRSYLYTHEQIVHPSPPPKFCRHCVASMLSVVIPLGRGAEDTCTQLSSQEGPMLREQMTLLVLTARKATIAWLNPQAEMALASSLRQTQLR
jgi:hypothetical protein